MNKSNDKEIEYITFTDLKEKRGWSKRLIDNFLFEPDLYTQNTHRGRDSVCKLYKMERVLEVEAEDEEFHEEFEKVKKRRNSALKSVNKKRQELFDYINNLEIRILEFPTQQKLFKAAINHYNNLQFERENYFATDATTNSDAKFLKRISVNFLRHSCVNYEPELDQLFGKIGRNEGYWMLKEKINDLIYEKYPFLEYTEEEKLSMKRIF